LSGGWVFAGDFFEIIDGDARTLRVWRRISFFSRTLLTRVATSARQNGQAMMASRDTASLSHAVERDLSSIYSAA
jgi:hypothetical protein